jgi:hypothetical protein
MSFPQNNRVTDPYPIGCWISSFRDANATVSDGLDGLNRGIVNGKPWRDEDGVVTHLKVLASRDKGREDTTIIVAIENVMGRC